jgi:PAS domain S-box-containing protein
MNTDDNSADSDRSRGIRAEEMLREYEKAVESSHDIIVTVDRDYRYRLVNATFLNYRGMLKEQVIGRSVAEIMGRDVFEQVVKENIDRCFQGETVRYEMKHTYPGLGERALLVSCMPVRGAEGIDRVTGAIRDITDQKKAENALQESEEKFRLLFEESVDPILLLDGDTFMECNEAAVRLMGCSGKAQLIGLRPVDLSPERQPDGSLSSEKARELIDAALRKGVNRFEWVHRTFDGEDRWVDVSLTTIPLCGKRIMHTVWRDINITERKCAEEALKAAHQQLSEIIELLPDATFVIDLEKRVIAWNRAIEEMTGVKKEDMLGKGDYAYAVPFYGKPRPVTIDLVLGDAEGFRQYDFVKPEGDALLTGSYVPMAYEGKGAYLSAKASPLFDAEGHVIGAVESIRDVTEQKQTEEALRDRERELEDKSVNLEEANAALKVLLRHRDEDKKTLESTVLANIRGLVFPYIEKLRSRSLNDSQTTCLNTIESNLNEVISPFLQKMTAMYAHFTPMEIQVADLIKNGRTSKEIGELLKVSMGTVHTHRNNIRKKLGLSNEKTNLRTYLLSLQE